MKFHLLPKAEIRDNDPASMREDIQFLLGQGVDVRRPAKGNGQLKLDETTNYYPGKGTLFVNGEPHAWPEKGRSALNTEPALPELNPRYTDLAHSSGLFREPDHAALRVNPLQQLFREHLLAQATVMRGDYAEAYFVLIAPRLNHLVQNSAALYASFLSDPVQGQVPFVNVHLEQLVEAYGWAGDYGHATALHERYLAWDKVDEVVRAALKAKAPVWPTEQAKVQVPKTTAVRPPKPKAA